MIDLNDGRAIPALGFGTFKIPNGQAGMIVRRAIDIGYTLIDTAAFYENERGVGEGLANEQAFVTTKLWNDRQGDPEAALDESLALLGRDSVDLYLIHWPCPMREQYVDAWKAMVKLREAGKAKSIGVSNFLPDHIERIVDATGVVPVLNQIELHPHFQQREARAFHDKYEIVTQSWSPLGQGNALNDPAIGEIARKHDATPAQVILAWHLASGFSVIPKAADEAHMQDNYAAVGLTLDADDLTAIDAMDDAGGRIGPDPMAFGG